MGAVLALLASVSWGTGDFIGGTLSRRAHPIAVMHRAQSFAVVGLLVVAIATGSLNASGYLIWGAAGGVVGVIALGCFYTALAEGTMGVVAPVAATGVIVPVGISLARGEAPHVVQLVGIVVTVAGVILASGPEPSHGEGREVRPLLLALVASIGFGLTLVLVAEGAKHSIIMTLLTMRIVNVAFGSLLLLTVARKVARPHRRDIGLLIVGGATDAGANGLYAVATRHSLVSISSVLASLYPAMTAILAWRFHQERLRRIQLVGVVATLGGVCMIAGGG